MVIEGKTIAKNTVFNLFGQAVPVLIALLSIPALVRVLGTERFGILSLIWVTFGYAQMFDLGFAPAITKYSAEALCKGNRSAVKKIVLSGLSVQTAMGLIAMIALLLATPYLTGRILKIDNGLLAEAKRGFYIASFGLPAVLVANSFRSLLAAFQRFDLINLVRVPLSVSNAILPLIGALLGWSFAHIILALVLVLYLYLLLFFLFSVRIYPEFLRHGEGVGLSDIRLLARFGGWVSVSGFLAPVFLNLDRFFVGSLVSVSAVAFYTVPYEMTHRLGVIAAALTTVLFPALSGLHGTCQRERISVLIAHGLKYVLLIGGLITAAAFLFGEDFLRVWISAEYAAGSSAVLKILAAGFLVNSLAFIPSTLIQATGRPDITAKFHLIELPFYVVLLAFLTRLWGIEGTAICWILRALVDAVLLFATAHRMHTVGFGAGLVRVAFHMVIFGAAALALSAFGGSFLVKLACFSAGSCLVVFSFWRTLDIDTRGSIINGFSPRVARSK